MPKISKREVVAAAGCAFLSLAAAALAAFGQLRLALVVASLLIGLIGVMVVLTGAALKGWVLKAERRLYRQAKLAKTKQQASQADLLQRVAATQRSVRSLSRRIDEIRAALTRSRVSDDKAEAALASLERSIDAVRFSQSVVTQGLSTTKGVTAETAELVRSTSEQVTRLEEATTRLADDLGAAFSSAARPDEPALNGSVAHA